MKNLSAILVLGFGLGALAACDQGDIPVPSSGPGRQDALCAIAFSQWLSINPDEVVVTGRGARGANALVNLRSRERGVTGVCEITAEYGIVAMVVE